MKRHLVGLLCLVVAVFVLGCEEVDGPRDQVKIANRLNQDIVVEHQVFTSYYESRSAHWSATPVKAGETVVIEAGPEEYEPPYSYTIHVIAGGVKKTFHVMQDNPVLVVTPAAMGL